MIALSTACRRFRCRLMRPFLREQGQRGHDGHIRRVRHVTLLVRSHRSDLARARAGTSASARTQRRSLAVRGGLAEAKAGAGPTARACTRSSSSSSSTSRVSARSCCSSRRLAREVHLRAVTDEVAGVVAFVGNNAVLLHNKMLFEGELFESTEHEQQGLTDTK